MAQNFETGDWKADTPTSEAEMDAVFAASAEDTTLFFTPSREFSQRSESGDDDSDDSEKIGEILAAQLEQLTRRRQWSKDGIAALRNEIADDSEDETWEPSMSDYQWSSFLHDWRWKLGQWGKRILDVQQYGTNDDHAKAAHLLVEIYRRRLVLASCKAHMLKLLEATKQGNKIPSSTDANQ